jgi:hypothetical protein
MECRRGSSYLKYGLCQIELDRQAALTDRFDSEGKLSKEQLGEDVWEPLRKLTANLLPHLRDLSSGEKAIIQLFYPLVEHQVKRNIQAIRTGLRVEPILRDLAMLIDEPELHLHPNLQAKILEYIRKVALEDKVQFILATHSPTIVEQANSSELFLLRPSELVPADDNQLVQIASDDDRLALMKDIFGTTSNITAMRKIVVVESVDAHLKSRSTSDARIYGFLSDRFGQVTLVSGGSKSECKAVVDRLNSILKDLSPQLRANAVLDRDIDEEPTEDGAIYLPVSMIENLLVDPGVIWEAITTVRHKTLFESASSVESALNEILANQENHEVGRRAKTAFGMRVFRLRDPVDEAETQIEQFILALRQDLSSDKLAAMLRDAEVKVSKLKTENKRREHFDGKVILQEFFKQHLHASGMSREIFIYECARQASKRRSVAEFVTKLFAVIGIDEPKSVTKASIV